MLPWKVYIRTSEMSISSCLSVNRSPSALIESLGAYAVDEMTADGTQNHYFHTRQEAIRYLEELTGQASLRETTLEDVFVERAGKHLISK